MNLAWAGLQPNMCLHQARTLWTKFRLDCLTVVAESRIRIHPTGITQMLVVGLSFAYDIASVYPYLLPESNRILLRLARGLAVFPSLRAPSSIHLCQRKMAYTSATAAHKCRRSRIHVSPTSVPKPSTPLLDL